MSLADIYDPDTWNGFFTMVGGGVAALTGLVFVALSLNVREMTVDATHKYRSINTLAGLAAVFVRCGLVLMGDQGHRAVAADLFFVAALGALSFLYGFQQAFKFDAHPSRARLAVGTALYVVEMAGCVVLFCGCIAGLYMAAVAILLNVAFMISAAWLLVVGVYGPPAPLPGPPTRVEGAPEPPRHG